MSIATTLKQLAETQKELAELGVDISEPTFYDLRSPFDDQKLPIATKAAN